VQKRQIDRSRSPAKARSCFTMKQSPFFRIFVGPTLRCFALCSHVCFAPCVCALRRCAFPTCRVFLQGSSLIARRGVCPFVQIWQESVDPNSWTSLHSGSRWCLSRFRCSPRLNTRMTKTSKRTKQLSFSNLFLLRPAGAEVGRPSVPQAFHRHIARMPHKLCPCPLFQLGSQLISSISLSLCESRPGVAESNRNGRGVEVAQIAPSQKAAQANCKIARTLPRVKSDQN
jgi:hypothetical protein